MRSFLIATVSALTLSACAVGPDFVAPTPPVTASGPFLSARDGVTSTAPADAQWWRLYKDPVLDGLVTEALAANTDIRVAVARIAKARASLREVRGDRLPSTNLSAGATYGRASESQVPPGADRTGWQVDAGLTVGYEVDLFGRVSRGIEAARGDVAAAEADADAVRVTVAAETARAYADAASAAERLTVAERIVALLDKSVALTARRAEVGLTTRLDTARVAALRDQRRADIPAIAAERDAALFRLATLTGRTPADLPPIAAERRTTLRLDQPIPVGDGAALLARRPDVAAAERRLAASTARIGVATADLYPKITLGGSIGQTSGGLGDLFGGGPLRWLLGPLINWNFLNQEAARAHRGVGGRHPGLARYLRRHRPARARGNRDGAFLLRAHARPPHGTPVRARSGRDCGEDHPRAATRGPDRRTRRARRRTDLRRSRSVAGARRCPHRRCTGRRLPRLGRPLDRVNDPPRTPRPLGLPRFRRMSSWHYLAGVTFSGFANGLMPIFAYTSSGKYTTPSLTTIEIVLIDLMSLTGSPGTRRKSANLPRSIEPSD